MGKLTTPIPQDKIGESFVWREWFQKLSDKVFGTLASQDANAVEITGGTIKGINFDGIAITNSTIDATRIGSKTPSTGIFSTLALLNPLGIDSEINDPGIAGYYKVKETMDEIMKQIEKSNWITTRTI